MEITQYIAIGTFTFKIVNYFVYLEFPIIIIIIIIIILLIIIIIIIIIMSALVVSR